MQLGSGGAVIPLPAAGQGRVMLGDQENSIFTAHKAIDWLIIYALFTQNLVLSEEFLYKLIFRKGVPPSLILRHPPLDPACTPFLKSLFPFPSFLFHPLFKVFQTVPPTLTQSPTALIRHTNLLYT